MICVAPACRVRRQRLLALVVVVSVGSVLLLSYPVGAGAVLREATYCSPTGDYCQGSLIKAGRRHLMFTTFSVRGRMRLCVQSPRRHKVCKLWRLRYIGHSLYEIDVTWRAHYPRDGRGVYSARFSQGAFRGPVIRFRS